MTWLFMDMVNQRMFILLRIKYGFNDFDSSLIWTYEARSLLMFLDPLMGESAQGCMTEPNSSALNVFQ